MTTPEIRHLLIRIVWQRLSPFERVLAWSAWRRSHQAIARTYHYRKRRAP